MNVLAYEQPILARYIITDSFSREIVVPLFPYIDANNSVHYIGDDDEVPIATLSTVANAVYQFYERVSEKEYRYIYRGIDTG